MDYQVLFNIAMGFIMALYDTPVDDEGMPTGNAPINDWPEEI